MESPKYRTLKLFCSLFLLLICGNISAQSPCGGDDLCVVQFNAGFNEANKVSWISELSDCESIFIDIGNYTSRLPDYS